MHLHITKLNTEFLLFRRDFAQNDLQNLKCGPKSGQSFLGGIFVKYSMGFTSGGIVECPLKWANKQAY